MNDGRKNKIILRWSVNSAALLLAVTCLAGEISGAIPVLGIGAAGNYTTFYVETNQNSAAPAWTPEDPFPLDLREASKHSRDSIQTPPQVEPRRSAS